MSQIDRSRTLDNYLERVMELQREKSDALTLPELKEIARELGMSDEDMARADQAAAEHLQRGLGLLEHRLWDDAVRELSGAVALNPGDTRGLHALASAYKGRWLADGDPADRKGAEDAIRSALAIDPNHSPSLLLLRDLNESSGPSLATMSGKSRERLIRIVGIVVLAAVVLALILLVWGGRRATGAMGA